ARALGDRPPPAEGRRARAGGRRAASAGARDPLLRARARPRGRGGRVECPVARAAGATMLAVAGAPEGIGPVSSDGVEVTIRGPMSYAGPGSLGGTESALRR